ncbi:ABC transporter permease [Roseococcus sp. YIM B11640]|uniref:ABC transporter permease n=1 Tax=Roseococcus sp. YIM B11640 TaxID=3133973 RepID=UPI003C79A072
MHAARDLENTGSPDGLEALAAVASQSGAHSFDSRTPRRVARAWGDLVEGFSSRRLATALAMLDLKNRYRGSVLGPFWVTLSTAAMLLGVGLLYGHLLAMPLAEYLPHLAVSLVVWNVMAGAVNDSCTTMIGSEGIIRQLRVPYTVHALRCMSRNAILALHNLPLVILIFLFFGHIPGWEALMALPGLALLAINILSACFLLGMICARFRDIGPIVSSVMQLAFFMTPVIWKPDQLSHQWLLLINPFYAMLEVIRGPLVAGGASAIVWTIAIALTAVHAAVAFAFFARFRGRIAFWV